MIKENILAPFEDSYWVVPGKLLAGYYPESIRTELRALLNIGVTSFIDLTEKNEGHKAFFRIDPYRKGFTDWQRSTISRLHIEDFP